MQEEETFLRKNSDKKSNSRTPPVTKVGTIPNRAFNGAKKNYPATKQTVTMKDINRSAQKYFETKRTYTTRSSVEQDSDASFLISLVPDISEMNMEQKRRFKIAFLSLASDILSETRKCSQYQTTDYPSGQSQYLYYFITGSTTENLWKWTVEQHKSCILL